MRSATTVRRLTAAALTLLTLNGCGQSMTLRTPLALNAAEAELKVTKAALARCEGAKPALILPSEDQLWFEALTDLLRQASE